MALIYYCYGLSLNLREVAEMVDEWDRLNTQTLQRWINAFPCLVEAVSDKTVK